MALIDDINALPTTVGDGNTGHLNNHQVIHAGLKSHESRLTTHRHASEGITDAVSAIPSSPNRVVKTNADGKISITTASITAQGDPVNKAYVDGRVPDTLALRLDTTVGTRIFAGNTMIHGDTGIRSLHSTTTPPLSGTGNVFLSRVGNRVYLEIGQYRAVTTSGGKTLFKIPTGFQPPGNLFALPVTDRDSSTLYSIDVLANGDVVETGTPPPGRLYSLITWTTKQAWPITLPGLPA